MMSITSTSQITSFRKVNAPPRRMGAVQAMQGGAKSSKKNASKPNSKRTPRPLKAAVAAPPTPLETSSSTKTAEEQLVEQLDGACARSLRLLEMESLDTAISAQARMWSRRRNRDDNADSRELEPFETVCKNSGPGGPRGGWGRAAHYDAKDIWMP
ncbi:hypothetical protein NFJ02_11g04900 [Pycnococcus provasolii]